MSDSVFSFKRFSVSNSRSGLKVGTDGVLLGALTGIDYLLPLMDDNPDSALQILDIGTGTGLIALMLSQRIYDLTGGKRKFKITGIDIDGNAAQEAVENFAASPWAENLAGRHCSLESFGQELSSDPCPERYDLIVSNPPYYDNSLQAPSPQRNVARHTCSLSFREIVQFAAVHLAPSGRLAMVLPKDCELSMRRYAASFGLYASRLVNICTTTTKPPKRIVVEVSREKPVEVSVSESLVIQSAPGCLTPEFSALTSGFYL